MKPNYIVLRHADAPRVEGVYSSWDNDSKYRNLSSKGVNQALELNKRFREEGLDFALRFHSSAPRTLYTIALASAYSISPIIQLEELFMPQGEDRRLLSEVFRNYAGDLEKYTGNPILFAALDRMGEEAARKVKSYELENDKSVLVGTHAIVGNFVAWHLANKSPQARAIALKQKLDTADRFHISGEEVRYIRF